jgi:hypothetical protein
LLSVTICAAEVEPTTSVPKLSCNGLTSREAEERPTPDSATTTGVATEGLLRVRLPVLPPAALGLKAI